MKKIKIWLSIFLISSLIFNGLVFSFYLEKYSVYEMFSRFLDKGKIKELKLPQIPQTYEKDILKMSFEKNVKNKNDFNSWQNSISEKFLEMYSLKNIHDFSLQNQNVEYTIELDSNILTKYSANALDGDKIIFYELKPKEVFKLKSAVFIIPGSGNQGASDVLGLESKYDNYYYQKNIGEKLANEGFIVYTIENRGWGERAIDAGLYCDEIDAFCSGNFLREYLPNVGKDLLGLQISDSLQVLNFIQKKEYVDSQNIAVVGLSLGGVIAQGIAIVEPEIKSVVIASGLVSYYKTGGTGATPGMLEFFDYPDMVASLAPKPVYLSWGENEKSNFKFEVDTGYSADIVKKAYSMIESEQNVTIIIHNDKFNEGHTYDIESILVFLKNTLKEYLSQEASKFL